MPDPYAMLGVPRTASPEEIKRSYHRLAKRLHPDLNRGDRSGEQRFKEVTAAYDLLSDPEKRARFDRGEIDGNGAERTAGFSGASRRASRRAASQEGFSIDDVIAEFLGRGRRQHQHSQSRTTPQPDRVQKLRLSFLEAALGGKCRVELEDGRSVDVTIPAGVAEGQRLRLRGGDGPIFLEIDIDPHPLFSRKGADVHTEVPVNLVEAVLGATITVATIHGAVAVKVPRGSNTGSLLRLKSKGVQAAGAAPGDHYVKLRVVLPDPPDPELATFLERWAKTHDYPVRGDADAG
jgi:DnaJ-class molecular chaperone